MVVSVLSDGTKDNTVKINLTYDTELEKALSQALEKNGKVGTTYLKNLLGIDGVAVRYVGVIITCTTADSSDAPSV